jgi:periplasmic nitrate reductase NapD
MSNGYVQRDAEGVPREFNICGVLVQARPERQLDVEAALAELPGVEIHQKAQDGRLIVTVEDTDQVWASETLANVHKIKGVIAASLVYHHRDTDQGSEELES